MDVRDQFFRGHTLKRLALRRLAASGLAALVGVACSRDRPPTPAATNDSVSVLDAVPPPPRTLSRLDVPLDYDFTPIVAVVERIVPRAFGSLDSVRRVGTDDRKHYAFAATRGDFTAFAKGSDVHLRTTLSYEARGFYKPIIGPTLSAGCGNAKDRPKIVVELVTPLTITGNWHLHSTARLARLAPASNAPRDRCAVSILSYDVTDRVVQAARKALVDHLDDIDAKIARVDLTERANGWWSMLNRPIRLAEGIWLMLQPTQLRLGDVSGDGQMLTIHAGLDAYPAIVTGSEPQPTATPLPPLTKDTLGNGFNILLEGSVDYATASSAMTDALRGKTVTQAGQSVTVQSIRVSPDTAGRLALAVAFTGDATGTLRLVGTPQYLPTIGMMVVPDLDFDLTTNKDLINLYSWLRSDALRELLRGKASVPVAPVLDRGKALLLSGLNRTIGGVMTMSATVDSVTVNGLYVTKAGLLVRAGASGNARLMVHQPR